MMLLESYEALGTRWYIEILEDVSDIEIVRNETKEFLEKFEARYSRFRSNSWLSKLNQEKVFYNPDPEFVMLLNESLRYYEVTSGVFNIAIGEKMEQSGYDALYSFTKTEDATTSIPLLPDALTVTNEKITLQEARLDLGGIGKGFVIDALTKHYRDVLGLQSFVINGGGDIYATHDNEKPITITLSHPKDKQLGIGTVTLLNQGFAASSPFVRAWKDKNTAEDHNHLHTTNKIASYVVADTACEADVWATTCAIDSTTEAPSTIKKLLIRESIIIHNGDGFKLNNYINKYATKIQ
jgi:thiamine biosynthesis lipoprotein